MDTGHRVCFRVIIDPSTPVSSLLEAPTVTGVSKPLIVEGPVKASEAIRMCGEGCEVVVVVDSEGRIRKAVSLARLASVVATRGDIDVSEVHDEVSVLSVDDSVEKLIEELVFHGGPTVIVDSRGRPLYSVGTQILSRILQEEVDVEEVKAAD
ncbi:MAG: hypothetical protein F7B17_03075 [Desulfurococcales archaeon]|nr:hypothetical protein [Desulfurococcales archaeon]